uniref:Uncharacterized protein n=1 Tax=Globisporangium ultimum (strain ATCC 200006 / CBS 805.95 / DAOM BR144) TaxID=431595 RepID=K3X991_GLOUD
MGTKKTPLSYEASLGACISFAGHVLGSPLTPSQVCTKGALASIVVEAHRLGQQIGKVYSAGNAANKKIASVDPRKLLKQMQISQREPEWDHPDDAMITGLVFQNLTWDSQGNVTDMLEMELLELELRARESNTSKHASKEEIRYEQPLEAAQEEETLQQRQSFIAREALPAQCPANRSIFTFPLGSQEKSKSTAAIRKTL